MISTGYGYHADYMMGWPEDVLKQAMAQCNDQGGQVSSCPVVTSRSEQDMNDCAQPNRVAEQIDGCEFMSTLFEPLDLICSPAFPQGSPRSQVATPSSQVLHVRLRPLDVVLLPKPLL